jgi:DNA-binding PadR family transcriptional regulator
MVILNPYFLECFKDYNYFKSIINIIQKISLSKIELSYLHLFVRYPHYSAYDIEHDNKMLDEKGYYKLNDNAYRRAKIILRKLCKLKLIKLDKDKEKNPRKKKFYSLTDIGLFYIIRLPTFLSIDIQAMFRNYPNFKIFKDLLYHFINLDTLSSENIPRDILNAISLYIQKHCSNIENFISYTINNNNWGDETEWNWDSESLREYLIDKYKYKWLENAETKEYYDPTILRFFNKKNIMSLYT